MFRCLLTIKVSLEKFNRGNKVISRTLFRHFSSLKCHSGQVYIDICEIICSNFCYDFSNVDSQERQMAILFSTSVK